jgi:bacillithiol synthase
MQLHKFPFADTNSFSSFFLDYIDQKEILKPFYHRFPAIEKFNEQIKEKQNNFPSSTRSILVDTLKEQYELIETTDIVKANINSLANENTFTITTGHQLNIFTGPLYFIYKIVTTINTAKKLKEHYPDFNFVPVFWMASEDHDYDEIKYFRLYGKKYEWKTDQQGAVGRFSPNGLADLLNEIPGEIGVFREAYTKSKTLADAVRYYVDALFCHEGLVVIDADCNKFKKVINQVIREDIFDGVNKPCVDKTTRALEDLGYKTQVYCRDINFFYLDENLRGRIEKSGDRYNVVDTKMSFTKSQLEEEIENFPERFSPNVILRPLYQEMILPNLAYIGGPAEMVYWLQLKEVFDRYHVPFPMLLPRNFAIVMDHEVSRKLGKTGLELKDIFEEKNYLFNHWVLKHSPRNLTVGTERTSINEIFDQLRSRAESVDKSLSPFVGAEGKRVLNSLEKIERKLLRAEKRLHGDKLRQIEFLKDSLFPNGNPQERADNFLNFAQQNPGFISTLLETLDPFDFRFNVLTI